MDTETVTLQLPSRLYANLAALAAEEQTDLVEMLTRLVALAYQHRALSRPVHTFPRTGERAATPGAPTPLAEVVRQSLGLSLEQWRQLHQDLPPAAAISKEIGALLPPATKLSSEIVAMREG